MPDNFRYLYNHCRHESETYDLTECRRSQIGYAEYTVQSRDKITSASKETPAAKA